MCDDYPRWDIREILNNDERACLYLKAAGQFDTGNGDILRLAWRDVQESHYAGRISINMAMSAKELSEILTSHGIEDALILKITSVRLMGLQAIALPMAA